MEDRLQFWTLREWLTLHEAASLICDDDPSVTFISSADEAAALDLSGTAYVIGLASDGYDAMYGALKEAVEMGLDTEFRQGKQKIVQPSAAIFTPMTVKNYDLSTGDIHEAQIEVIAIKKWLTMKEIQPAFFFPEQAEQQVKSKSDYQTRLMSIMYATIDRYYGDNYEHDNSDTVPKQVDVIEWLVTNFSLSDAKAKAIDKLTRPDHSKSPKG